MMYKREIRLTAAMLALSHIFSAAAFADDQEQFKKLLSDPAQIEHAVRVAGRSTVFQQNPCPTAQFTPQNRTVIYEPPVFDATSKIVAGAWKLSVDEEGCGAQRVLNVVVRAQGPNTIAVTPLLPGTTRADPVLQRDAVKFVRQAIMTTPEAREPDSCQTGYIADTEFVEEETTRLPDSKGPSWRELWTLVSCSKRMEVPVHFIPDVTGTSVSAGPNTAIKVSALDAKAD
jgi:hypothetical protein